MHALNLFNECEFGHKLEGKESTNFQTVSKLD